MTRILTFLLLALLVGSTALADRDREGDGQRGRVERDRPEARHHHDREREHDEHHERGKRDGDRDGERHFRGDRDGDWEDDERYFRRDRDRDRHLDEDWEDDDIDERDFDFGGEDDFEGDDHDPFAEHDMWVDNQVRRTMARGGIEAVSRMVSHEFGTPEGEFLEFVSEHMPEVNQAKGPRAVDMVSNAVNSYGMYVEFREHDPEQAMLMVQHDRMEMMSGQLAGNIEILRRRARRDGNTQVKEMLKKNEGQLKEVLNRLFQVRQKQQEFEIRDLQAEVQELRELAERRAQNRERIVERQFLELTGQGRAVEW